MLQWGFASDEIDVQAANSRRSLTALLDREGFHVACFDTRMEDEDPLALLEVLRRRVPQLPVVALFTDRDRRRIERWRDRGVDSHLIGPFAVDTVRSALIGQALDQAIGGPEPEPAPLPPPPASSTKLVAQDDVARRMLEIALRAAPSNVAILILGETGTGKNLIAQTIHERSPLRAKPFVTVSCPSLSQELLESDLFGHVRGAYTGATQDTWGKVAAADGGTLFLDEIGDLPTALQPKLLRLLQEKQYERVGETTQRMANVRIIAATNRDLKAEVAAGHFREDLYYRLNVITLEVPPLRCRPADIIPAAEQFLDTICQQLSRRVPTFTPEARRLLESYSWPGNLRELRNVIERAAVLAEAPTLGLDDFPSLVAQPSAPIFRVGAPISLEALEAAHIQLVVAKSATLEEAARILAIDKSTLYRKRKAMEARVAPFAAKESALAAAAGWAMARESANGG